MHYLIEKVVMSSKKIVKVEWDTIKNDRILTNDYNHGLKYFKIYNIFTKNAFIKFHER